MLAMEVVRNGFLRRFQQLRLYHDEIDTSTWNQEEIPLSSGTVSRRLSVADGP